MLPAAYRIVVIPDDIIVLHLYYSPYRIHSLSILLLLRLLLMLSMLSLLMLLLLLFKKMYIIFGIHHFGISSISVSAVKRPINLVVLSLPLPSLPPSRHYHNLIITVSVVVVVSAPSLSPSPSPYLSPPHSLRTYYFHLNTLPCRWVEVSFGISPHKQLLVVFFSSIIIYV